MSTEQEKHLDGDSSGDDAEDPAAVAPPTKEPVDPVAPSKPKSNRMRFILISIALVLIICAIVIPLVLTQTDALKSSKSSAALDSGEGADDSASPPASTTNSSVTPPTSSPVAPPSPTPDTPNTPATNTQPSASPVVAATNAPSTAPGSTLDSSLLATLSAASFAPNAFSDDTSCEYAAAKWLQDTDTMLPSVAEAVVQRYAVLVSLICLSNSDFPAMANANLSECSWEGVNCTDDTVTKIVWANMGLSGTVPLDLGLLDKVVYLDLGENALAGTIPEGIFEMKNLTELYLHQNRFSGTISDRFSELFWLEKLFLFENQLSGSFPSGLASPGLGSSNARPLRYLLMADNNIGGTIPENLNWRSMFFFDISNNQVSGGLIPSDWLVSNQPISLRHLFASNNKMSGSLPDDFASLANDRLVSLVINDNSFTGEFPSNWQETTLLQVLEIQNNNFTKLSDDICKMEVYIEGELTTLRADCDICNCQYFCDTNYCTA